jgi:hypothetical protein
MRVAVEYDRGLSSPQDTLGRYRLERTDLPSLGAGESSTIDLDFSAVQVGEQCYRVQVTADGMASAADRQCITVESEAPAARPQLRIQTALDAVREVGQKLNYIVTIYNDGSAPASNLAIEVLSDPQLVAKQATSGSQPVARGVRWEGESIPARGSISFDAEFDCVAQSDQAKVTAYVLFSESDYEEKTDAVEIRPARPSGGTPAPAAPRGDLEGVVSSSANPAQAGQPATLNFAITNRSAAAMAGVQYRLVFEPNKIQPTAPGGARLNQNTLEFLPIATLGAGESFRFAVPYTPLDQGVTTVWLEMRVGATGATATAEESISIRPR